MGIKLDLDKAYDFLNWDYVRYVLKKIGFNQCWINLIMQCITSISCSIIINGEAHCYFYLKCGIQQGDPLSPYVFILSMESLIRHLNKMTENSSNHIGILCSPRGFKISNLVFPDDCLLFARAITRGARNICLVLCLRERESERKAYVQSMYAYGHLNLIGSR